MGLYVCGWDEREGLRRLLGDDDSRDELRCDNSESWSRATTKSESVRQLANFMHQWMLM